MTAMQTAADGPFAAGGTVVGGVVADGGPFAAGGTVVEFVEAIPGFPDESTFALSSLDDRGQLFALRSLRTPTLRFVLLAPGAVFPGYAPAIHEDDVTPLGVLDNDEVQLFLIVTIRDSIKDATANLLAPILLVPGRNTAMQVILSDDRLPLRAPLLALAVT